jgi:hypothetical protein
MSKNTKKILLGILVIGIAALLSGIAMAGEEVAISGTINEDGQLVDQSGMAYDIGDTEQGNEVMELVGKKVSVQGTVMEAEGTKVITITSYELVE